jgi:hypothetical protein
MRTTRSAYHLASSLCLVLALSGLLPCQSAKSARSQEEPNEQMEGSESVQRREQWFLQGRDTRPGQSAATLRRKAVQQKLWMRSVRSQKLAAAAKLHPAYVPGSGSWTSLGPAPVLSDGNAYRQVTGRVTSVAIDPADATGNTVFVSGAQGGVWKSTNAAATNAANVTWTPLTDAQPTLATGVIAIQPGNSNPAASVVLVGTGEGNSSADSYLGMGILRSTDGGAAWSLISNAGGTSLDGLGTTHMAFSMASPNTVVAAMKSTGVGFETGSLNTNTTQGLYTSTDAGRTWTYNQLIEPSGQQTVFTPATSVVYNGVQGQFFAAIRDHGFYSSPDGVNWTRLTTQPDSQLSTTNCPAQPTLDVNGIETCPIYRGEIAVVPGRNEMYVWYVAFTYINSTTVGFVDEGIWRSINGGQSWSAISTTAIDNCGDPQNAGCGVYQGWYDLTLASVPNGASGTDLYAGAVNLFKCSVNSSNPSCSTQPFLNLTHVYGCDTSQVHPDEHATAFTITGSGTDLMYFGNDGGVYRALDGFTGLPSGSCTAANKFDDLNQNLGPLTQFVGMSQDPTNPAVLMGGTQDNGTEAIGSAPPSMVWTTVQGGDGGYNAIDPNAASSWFASVPDPGNGNLDIRHCSSGVNCTDAAFSSVVTSANIGGDDGPFYPFYTLDPQSPSSMLVGTCRVWRGPRLGGSYVAVGNLANPLGNTCTGAELNTVRSIAAGGPTDSNGSQVVYATTNGVGPYAYIVNGNLEWTGQVWVTTNASSGPDSFHDVTGNINQNHEPISSVAVDSSDATGQTAYVGVMGFTGNGGAGHVYKTTNAGLWGDWGGSGAFALPDSPVNALVVDSAAQTIYAATDVGVFESSTNTPIWTEVGPAAGMAGFLPNVAVTGLALFNSGGQKLLRASTYGRGIWQFDVLKNPPTPVFYLTVPGPASQAIFVGQTSSIAATLTSQNGYNSSVSLSCTSASIATCGSYTPAIPASCAASPASVVPSATGAGSRVQASDGEGIYCFNLHAAGTDPNSIAIDSVLDLYVYALTMDPPSPATITIPHGSTSSAVRLNLVVNWPTDSILNLNCLLPTALTGATCNFPNPIGVYNGNNPVSMTMTVPAITQPGTYSVGVQADVPFIGIAPSQQTLNVVVTKNTTFLFSEATPFPNVKAGSAGSTGPITLSSLDGFSGTVQLSCAGTYPADSCYVTPSSVNVVANPVSVNVTIAAPGVEQSQAVVSGTSGAITQTINIPFNVGGYGIQQPNSFPSVGAGGSTSTTVTLSGIIWYAGTVQATCDASAIAGAQCTLMPAGPYVLTPNSGGDSMASFSATVSIPTGAGLGTNNIVINTADTGGQPTASVGIPLTIQQQDYQIGTITLAAGSSGSVSPGGSANYNFNVVPVSASYSGNITVACAISPATTTISCVLNPASVNPGNQAMPVVMTVSTRAPSGSQSANWFAAIAGIGLLLPVVGLLGGWRGSRGCRRLAAGGLLVFTLSCGGGASGGGGGGGGTGGTPPGTYTITVTGAPASLSEPSGQSAQLQVN